MHFTPHERIHSFTINCSFAVYNCRPFDAIRKKTGRWLSEVITILTHIFMLWCKYSGFTIWKQAQFK